RWDESRDGDCRTVDVDDFENLLSRCRVEHLDTREQLKLLLRITRLEIVNHHHAAEGDLLSEEAPRAAFSDAFEKAIPRGELGACHRLHRRGTLTATGSHGTSFGYLAAWQRVVHAGVAAEVPI